jgi:Holliday junction resolvase RusA-like endonuclease
MLDEKLFKKLKTIEIPEYIYQVKLSENRRAKYFSNKTGRGRVKKDIDKIPKKYKVQSLDLEGFYLDINGNRIVANPIAAGTAKYVPINGQLFYSNSGGEFTRGKVIKELHNYFKEILKDVKPFQHKHYPIVIQMSWYYPYGYKTPDNTNVSFAYTKAFEDTLTEMGIIEDDEVRFVTGSFPIYTPVPKFEDRKLVFTFYQDMRAEIQQFKML